MDIKIIKNLTSKYSKEELLKYADELENSGKTTCPELENETDLNVIMSGFLQSAEVKEMMDNGMPVNEAIREFSKRVRGVLN